MKKFFIFAAAALLALTTSCVKDIVYPYASYDGLANTIAYDENEAVTVTVKVNALVDIAKVTLNYTADGKAATPIEMKGANKVYSGTIPALPMGTVVKYYVEASTANGTSKSAEGTYTVGVIPIDYTPLKLNELNGNDKFIEIFNSGKEAINIKGLHILKDTKDVWTGPNQELGAGAYLLLYSKDVVAPTDGSEATHPEYAGTELVFDSGLSAKKNVRVQLTDPLGNSLDDLNIVSHPGSKVAGSYGRNKDNKWYIQPTATPGAQNTDGTDSIESWLEK